MVLDGVDAHHLGLVADAFPNFPKLYSALPGGIVETVVMLVVGGYFGALVLAHFTNGQGAIRTAFVLLSLPDTVLSLLALFGREGVDRELRWSHRLMGVPLLVFGVLLAVGTIVL